MRIITTPAALDRPSSDHEGAAISTIPTSPIASPSIWRCGGRRRTMRAATSAVKIGVAPLSIPVTLDETRSSANGNSDNGTAIHTTPSSTSRGRAEAGTGCRVSGTEATTSKPNTIRSHVTRNGSNDSSPSAMR